MNPKLIRNLCNGLHALCVVLAFLIGIPGSILVYISLFYFLCDTVYELCLKPVSLYEYGITVHHFFSMLSLIYLRKEDSLAELVYYFYFLLELSNLPMYLVYYLKQIRYRHDFILRSLLIFETGFYIYMRLYLGGSRVYEYFQEASGSLLIKTYMVIFVTLSTIWSLKLLNQILIKFD